MLDWPGVLRTVRAVLRPAGGPAGPSTQMDSYLQMMSLKFRGQLGFESLCRQVTDSISWRRFHGITLDGSVPHPTRLIKLTTRCGAAAVDGSTETLLTKTAEAKLLRTARLRSDTDTPVVVVDISYI